MLEDVAREACVQHLSNIRDYLISLAEDAGIADADGFARHWHILMKGPGGRGAAARLVSSPSFRR